MTKKAVSSKGMWLVTWVAVKKLSAGPTWPYFCVFVTHRSSHAHDMRVFLIFLCPQLALSPWSWIFAVQRTIYVKFYEPRRVTLRNTRRFVEE
jgi:hypothetical protein